MMAGKGIPLASVALVITLFIEIGGGLLVLTGVLKRNMQRWLLHCG